MCVAKYAACMSKRLVSPEDCRDLRPKHVANTTYIESCNKLVKQTSMYLLHVSVRLVLLQGMLLWNIEDTAVGLLIQGLCYVTNVS